MYKTEFESLVINYEFSTNFYRMQIVPKMFP